MDEGCVAIATCQGKACGSWGLFGYKLPEGGILLNAMLFITSKNKSLAWSCMAEPHEMQQH